MSFDIALPIILRFEGGYVNDPDDPGGATNKGITQSTYDSYRRVMGWDARPVRHITNAEIETIYKRDYWQAVRADKFVDTHPHTALCHFDCAVNQGQFIAPKLLQKAINICYQQEKVKVDGMIGPITIAALTSVHDEALVKKYLMLRKIRYNDSVNRNPKLKKWLGSYKDRLNFIAHQAETDWIW